jgi:hypothetical protein
MSISGEKVIPATQTRTLLLLTVLLVAILVALPFLATLFLERIIQVAGLKAVLVIGVIVSAGVQVTSPEIRWVDDAKSSQSGTCAGRAVQEPNFDVLRDRGRLSRKGMAI